MKDLTGMDGLVSRLVYFAVAGLTIWLFTQVNNLQVQNAALMERIKQNELYIDKMNDKFATKESLTEFKQGILVEVEDRKMYSTRNTDKIDRHIENHHK